MPNIVNTSRAQTKFLRSFKLSPFGPNVSDWPSAAILRRWLRKPGFIAAMRSVMTAMQWQADFQLLSAAAAAAHVLHTTVTAADHQNCQKEIKAMSDLLKLSHVRQRFTATNHQSQPRDSQIIAMLRRIHPDVSIGNALNMLDDPHLLDDPKMSAA